VCAATELQWSEYLEFDSREFKSSQNIRSNHMEWIDGCIYIVELPSPVQDIYGFMFGKYLLRHPVVDRYLKIHGRAFVPNQLMYEPDESFGPALETGAVLPSNMEQWWNWSTLKVEIGYLRQWGRTEGQLDWKAERWASFPGVRYILCVMLLHDLTGAEYKLYKVRYEGFTLPEQRPIRVLLPQTYLKFDSRWLLGLEHNAKLPSGFPKALYVDMYSVLDDARR
ncbi:hypothetical protein PHMEG_0009532, partial [Phytophthora megakarya]